MKKYCYPVLAFRQQEKAPTQVPHLTVHDIKLVGIPSTALDEADGWPDQVPLLQALRVLEADCRSRKEPSR